MSQQLTELENILRQQTAEHRALARALDAQHAAMRALDARAMAQAGDQQESCRGRTAALETRRRAVVAQLLRPTGHAPAAAAKVTLAELARLFPQRGPTLLRLRQELKAAVADAASRGHVAAKVAGAVLGHLNTVVRLVTGAVERAGLYTKTGTPKVSARAGMMDAKG